MEIVVGHKKERKKVTSLGNECGEGGRVIVKMPGGVKRVKHLNAFS